MRIGKWWHGVITNAMLVIRIVIYWLLYLISGFIPRHDNIMLYGCAYGFSNNSKYAFLFALANRIEGQHIYWVTNSEDDFALLKGNCLPVLKRKSIKGLWYCLRAKYYYFSWFADDINFWTSRGAILTNFWHGLPIKKIQYDIQEGSLGAIFNPKNCKEKRIQLFNKIFRPAFLKSPDFLYCPHKSYAKIFMSAFKIKEVQLIYENYPRVNYLLTHEEINFFDQIAFDYPVDKKKIIYMPTFRDFDRDWFSQVFSEAALKQLNHLLQKKNAVFYIKAHPNEHIEYASEYTNIINMAAQSDIYALLKHVPFDLYLTDYSSVVFEMMEISSHVALFWPDYKQYTQYSRASYFDLSEVVNKTPIHCVESLLTYIDKNI